MKKKYTVPTDRPAFLVDETLRQAARKAAKAFREEEEALQKELQKSRYAKI